MNNILLFGAGRSSPYLIQYLTALQSKGILKLTVADSINLENSPPLAFKKIDIQNEIERQKLIQEADIVISMLPPALHLLLANDCILFSKHFLTASYNTPALQNLSKAANDKGILFLLECGLDPGIDHMSAMKEIEDILKLGGTITSFKSYTGGLVAPESDDNPWNYKITWNPRNVVLAGQGTVKYLENKQYKFIPYHRLFATLETIHIDGLGVFEGYANRDSLSYIDTYKLNNIETFLRGTLRKKGFCDAWNLIVQLGLTDDSYTIENSEQMTWKEFTLSYLRLKKDSKPSKVLGALINKGPGAQEIHKLKWLGLFDEIKTGIPNASPALLLQKRIEHKLVMKPEDKDMIVMQHIFDYTLDNKTYRRTSTLVLKGENQKYTAMAKTVGLPLGIAVKLILENKLKLSGVHIPVLKELYEPMLAELEMLGVSFTRKDIRC